MLGRLIGAVRRIIYPIIAREEARINGERRLVFSARMATITVRIIATAWGGIVRSWAYIAV
jgi:hypothetical protein